MAAKRIILEMGSGNDLHGGDYTKAAIRAVQDALHHSSLTFLRSFGLDSKQMQVEVTIGAQRPERVDAAAVKATLPHGQATVNVVKGGLDIPSDDGHTPQSSPAPRSRCACRCRKCGDAREVETVGAAARRMVLFPADPPRAKIGGGTIPQR